jgi:hypothetical protein
MRFLLLALAACALPASAFASPETPAYVVGIGPLARDVSSLRFVELTVGKLAAVWEAQGRKLWVQRLAPDSGTRIGLAASVGQLVSANDFVRAFALPDGDLGLVGALADGRITFARGSARSDRRVGAKVLIPKARAT